MKKLLLAALAFSTIALAELPKIYAIYDPNTFPMYVLHATENKVHDIYIAGWIVPPGVMARWQLGGFKLHAILPPGDKNDLEQLSEIGVEIRTYEHFDLTSVYAFAPAQYVLIKKDPLWILYDSAFVSGTYGGWNLLWQNSTPYR